MFGNFLNNLKRGGFAGNGGNANLAMQGMATPPPAQSPEFIGPMVNQGMRPMAPNSRFMGMSKAPAFGFMNRKPQVSNRGPQRPKPNRNRLRAF